MKSTNERARTFFENPDLYLRNNYRITLRAMLVKQMLGDIADCRVLDLGCGDGRISAQFLAGNNRVTMLDLSAGMLERARRNTPASFAAQVDYVHSDIFGFSPAAPYDVVLCIGVLAHVGSTEETIAKVASFVKPSGHCIFQISDGSPRLYSWVNSLRRLVSRSSLRYTPMTLPEVVAMAGRHRLTLLESRRHLLLPFPGMARLLGRWLIPYDLYTSNNPVLSKYSTDVLLLCKKDE